MRAFPTGANGWIGTAVGRELLNAGHERAYMFSHAGKRRPGQCAGQPA